MFLEQECSPSDRQYNKLRRPVALQACEPPRVVRTPDAHPDTLFGRNREAHVVGRTFCCSDMLTALPHLNLTYQAIRATKRP